MTTSKKYTVKELMNLLESFDPNMIIVVDGYEGGLTEKLLVEEVFIEKNKNKEWWYGEHQVSDKGEKVLSIRRERKTN